MLVRRLLPALLALALLPGAAHAVEPGMVIGGNTTVDEVAKTKEAGATWVRIFVDWSAFDEATTVRRLQAYKRAGVNTLVVVSYTPASERNGGSKITPPSNPASYGRFIEHLAKNFGEWIDAYEMWNEPDENIHFAGGPNPEAYVPLLQQGYNAVQRADRDATVVTGGMVGNNFDFLDAIYKLGGKGYFDAVGVHTDLACERDAPEFQYRDEQGRIGRYVFTGYREVAATMSDHGESKPIWMTEMGWPTPSTTCFFAGSPMPGKENEPGGVDYPTQADFLRRGFECMQGDGLVDVALWFSLQDISNSRNHEERFGLIDAAGNHKPAFGAMQSWAKQRNGTGGCGEPVDRTAPSVEIQWPPEGFAFAGPLTVRAKGLDNLRVNRMEMFVDGKSVGGSRSGAEYLADPWYGADDLPMGEHRLVIKAFDGAKNVGQQAVTVRRVSEAQVSRSALANLSFKAKKKRGLKVRVCANVSALPGAIVPPTGKVEVYMDIRRGRKWKKFTRLSDSVAKGICRTHKLRYAGKWRIRARYLAEAPYKNLRTPKRQQVVVKAR
jgi:hypothetical protein